MTDVRQQARVSRDSGGLTTRRVSLLLLLLVVVLALVSTWGNDLRTYANDKDSAFSPANYDFYVYYVAGRDFRLGLDPYVEHPEQPGPDYLHGGTGKLDRYIYPPTLLPVYATLSRLDYDAARILWLSLNLAAFAAAVAVAALAAGKRWLEVVVAAGLITAVSFSFLYSLRQGQIDLFVSSITIIGFLLYGKWHSWPAALLLALAVVIKIMPVVVLLALVAYHRDLRLLGKAALGALVLVLVSLLWVDPGTYAHYLTSVLPVSTRPDPFTINLSPLQLLAGAPLVAKAVSLIGYGLLAVMCFDAGRRSRDLSAQERWVPLPTEGFAVLLLAVVFALLFSPLLWIMTLIWLIVPAALAVTAPAPHRRPWAPLALAGCLIVAMTSTRFGLLRTPLELTAVGLAATVVAVAVLYLPFFRPKAPATRRGQPERRGAPQAR